MKITVLIAFIIGAVGLSDVVQSQTTPANVYVDNVCICVTTGYCGLAGGNQGNTDGSGNIDPRIMTSGGAPSPITGANNSTMVPTSSGIKPVVVSQATCQPGLELCCPTMGFSCGLTYPPVAGSPTPNDGLGQSKFGDYPWQVALLSIDNVYIGSGVLIDHLHVLTAAHKIQNVATPFKVRLGEWDAANQDEPLGAIEISVGLIFTHPRFNSKNLQYDLSVLRLVSNAPLGVVPTITNICLPSTPIAGIRCFVSGWGKNDFANTGQYQAIMRAIDVPLIDYDTCQKQLKATRLGANFVLDPTSFTCAGGESSKDACTGDGGSPLSCSVGGRWYLVGLVSWGIGCGTVNVPGVYVNIQNSSIISWIQQTTMSLANGLSTTSSGASVTTPMTTKTTVGATTTTFTMQSTSTPKAGGGVSTTPPTTPPTTTPPTTTPPTTTPPTTTPTTTTSTTTTKATTTAGPTTTTFTMQSSSTPKAGGGVNTTTVATVTTPKAGSDLNTTTVKTTPKVNATAATTKPTTVKSG